MNCSDYHSQNWSVAHRDFWVAADDALKILHTME